MNLHAGSREARLPMRPVVATVLALMLQAPAAADISRPTAHELAAIAGSPAGRHWYHEAEFLHDPELRVEPHHVVVLELEPAGRGRQLIENIVPYRLTETATHNFCVPRDDAHIRRLQLRREGSPGLVVNVPRGAPCRTITIEPGLHQLTVQHDARAIDVHGKTAFVHVPRLRSTPSLGASAASFSCDALNVIRAPNGNFVVRGSDSSGTVRAPSSSVDLASGGWQLCIDANGTYALELPRPDQDFRIYSDSAIFPGLGNLVTFPDFGHRYELTDLGDFQLIMKFAYNSATHYPIILGNDNLLQWSVEPGDLPTVFDILVKYYQPGTAIPPLQPGEVALFHGALGDTTHGTWVVRGEIPHADGISYSNPFLGTYELFHQSGGTPISVRVGPLTVASFFALSDYRIPLANIGEGTAGPNINSFGSIKVVPARDFIVSTNTCHNCNLTGIDLSGLDLSSDLFMGGTFIGANLRPTFAARISRRPTSTDGIVVSDLGFRPDLTGAVMDVGTFLPSDWRWLNLTGATISGVAGAVLSTQAQPLDLSAARLDEVDLSGAVLDFANLDGAHLNQASLRSVSLRRASLQNALLQGAQLDFATWTAPISVPPSSTRPRTPRSRRRFPAPSCATPICFKPI